MRKGGITEMKDKWFQSYIRRDMVTNDVFCSRPKYLFQVVIAAGQQESLRRIAAPAQEGGNADNNGVGPNADQDEEGLKYKLSTNPVKQQIFMIC
jgi:hypothetical protein